MPALSREQVCQSITRKLADAAPKLPQTKAMIGLDGFVDEIIAVVDKRRSLDDYDRVKTIDQIGHKILAAAGQSSNYELVVKHTKLGGNGPIMANALACAGMDVTYVGILGHPKIHPVFEEFSKRAKVVSIAEPGHTDALEFDDGKLMFGKHASLREVTWDNLIARGGGLPKLKQQIADASLVGIINWTMLPYLSDIWSKLASEVLPGLPKAKRYFFVDLCDPEKRTTTDLREAMHILSGMQGMIDVVLGLNLKEALQVAQVLDLRQFADDDVAIQGAAASIREKMQIGSVVIHPRRRGPAPPGGGGRPPKKKCRSPRSSPPRAGAPGPPQATATAPGSRARLSKSRRSAPAPATTSTPASASAACSASGSRRASAPVSRPVDITCAPRSAPRRTSSPTSSLTSRSRRRSASRRASNPNHIDLREFSSFARHARGDYPPRNHIEGGFHHAFRSTRACPVRDRHQPHPRPERLGGDRDVQPRSRLEQPRAQRRLRQQPAAPAKRRQHRHQLCRHHRR